MGALEAIWWLGAAWLAAGFLRAFVVLGRQPRESKMVQDLLAGLIYLAATFAIIAYVYDLPVKGLLATSGALAIIIGLALQSSLGDVFSGIVLNIERPYRVGVWIILDDTLQGKVIETNWRATHIRSCGPEPTVTIKDGSAEMIDFELFYVVADIGAANRSQNELFDRIYRAERGTRLTVRVAC